MLQYGYNNNMKFFPMGHFSQYEKIYFSRKFAIIYLIKYAREYVEFIFTFDK